MPVFKATYNMSVFGEFPTRKDAEAYFSNADLSKVLEEADFGDLIASTHCAAIENVRADKVRSELQAIGNDGDFFDGGSGELCPDVEAERSPPERKNLQARVIDVIAEAVSGAKRDGIQDAEDYAAFIFNTLLENGITFTDAP